MNKIRFGIINLVTLIVTSIAFVYAYNTGFITIIKNNPTTILIIIGTVLLVHFIKMIRLYLALYGSKISLSSHMKEYCKVTPVSIVLPFKIGEIFRMYCYGYKTKNYLRGIIIILLDRFMDTLGLVSVILLVWVIRGRLVPIFTSLLIIFLLFLLFIYFAFPKSYKFWTDFLLKANATHSRLVLLKILKNTKILYDEIANVAKGRGLVLGFLSVLAWLIEIGGVLFIMTITSGDFNTAISNYLTSAVLGVQTIELQQFIIVSTALLLLGYVAVKAVLSIKKEAAKS